MLFSRWGGLGNHRYPIGFSGDTYATWESLQFQPYFTATAANVAYGWWSHDIGGHFGATDPELYARWVQFGAVSPCLRLHSTKDPLAERRPWGYPDEVYEAAKAAFQFRYRLFPYLYSAARAAVQQGLSLCTPMYYEFPEAEDAYLARSQYFLGDQMFVAPIVTPRDPQTGLAPVDVWIPDGTWIDYTTLEVYDGPQWVRIYGDLNRIPIFVRAGAILPMAPRSCGHRNLMGNTSNLWCFLSLLLMESSNFMRMTGQLNATARLLTKSGRSVLPARSRCNNFRRRRRRSERRFAGEANHRIQFAGHIPAHADNGQRNRVRKLALR